MDQGSKSSEAPKGDAQAASAADAFRAGFVALVGDSNAGKSTLLNALVGERIAIVAPKPQTTRKRIQGVKTTPDAQFVFVDTPGFIKGEARSELNRSLLREAFQAISDVDAVALVLDAERLCREPGRIAAIKELFEARGNVHPAVVVLSKIDLVTKEALLPQIAAAAEAFSGAGAPPPIIPVSARKRDGLNVLLEQLRQALPEGPALFPEDTLTDQTERQLVAEKIREKAIRHLQQEVPHQLAVAVEEWDESERGLDIGAVIYVAKPNHKRIVVGSGGSMIKKIGIEARRDLEAFFETHINLRLFVSVKQDWPESRAGLRRVGLE